MSFQLRCPLTGMALLGDPDESGFNRSLDRARKYRIRIGPSAVTCKVVQVPRSAPCANIPCQDSGARLCINELAVGILIVGSVNSWAWKRWGYLTAKNIAAMKSACYDDPTGVPGWAALSDECKERVRLAFAAGRLMDCSFTGVTERVFTFDRGEGTSSERCCFADAC